MIERPDDPLDLLRAGRAALLPDAQQLEATRSALAAKLAVGAGSPMSFGSSAKIKLLPAAKWLKLVLAAVATVGAGAGYYAMQARSMSAPTTVTVSARPVAAPPPASQPLAAEGARAQSTAGKALESQPLAASVEPAQVPGGAREPSPRWTAARHRHRQRRATPATVPARTEPVVRMSAPPAGLPLEDTLALEVQAVRAAGDALRRGQPERALRDLDIYLQRFPHGALWEEQLALRAGALCKLGRRADAARVAQQLQRASPDSPHLSRLALECEDTQPRHEPTTHR